jgi:hypothetical protein
MPAFSDWAIVNLVTRQNNMRFSTEVMTSCGLVLIWLLTFRKTVGSPSSALEWRQKVSPKH